MCGSGTQLRDHRLSARSCHTCLRTALLRLGLWSPVSPSPDRGPSLTPSACCGAGSRRAGLSLCVEQKEEVEEEKGKDELLS